MSKAALVIAFLFVIAGCAKEQDLTQKKVPAVPVAEVKQIEPAQQVSSPEETRMIKQEEITEGSGAQVAPPVSIVEDMQAKVNAAVQQKETGKPSEAAEKIIAENRWGFSVYDPQTKIEAFYTSAGSLLGSKTR